MQNNSEENSDSYNVVSNNFSPALSKLFRERIRPVLQTINELRAQGLQKEIKLPAIAVVGDQSVGKSSVLEAISGVEFPRGTGIVTRCPLQLAMNSRDDNIWTAVIRYKTKKGEQKEVKLQNPSEIGAAIREAQDAITENQTDVNESPIEMNIEGPDCPDLTLIDLPGIARFSSSGSGTSIAAVTKNLILTYIQRPEVIILVVIPCHIDIETVEALGLAKEVDPEGKRTIGVLTCPDMINKGAEAEYLAIAKNQKMPLKKGYVTVRCRTPQELKDKRSLKDAAKEEDFFFKSHPHFRNLDESEHGSRTLAMKLSAELFSTIKNNIPEMLREIQFKREKYAQDLNDMGNGPPDDKEQIKEVIVRMLNSFCKEFHSVATGTYRHEEDRLFAKCRIHWNKLADDIENCALSNDSQQARELWDSTLEDIENQRGTELPGFDNIYPVLERTVRNKFLKFVKEPTSNFLVALNQEVDSSVRTIADKTFVDFPLLNGHIKTIGERIRSEMVEKSRKDIAKIFVQESYVFTQDRIFIEEDAHTEMTLHNGGIVNANSSENSNNKNQSKLEKKTSKNEDESEDEHKESFLVSSSSSYSSVQETTSSPKVLTPSQQKTAQALTKKNSNNTERVIQGLRTYIKVAIRRMIDHIPMTAMHYMLHEMSNTLTERILYLITEPENMYDLLEEDPIKQTQRRHLQCRIEKLQFAEQELAKL